MKANLIFIEKKQKYFFESPNKQKPKKMGELENDIFLVIGFFKKQIPNENQLGFHMRYHLFLHYG